MNNLSDSTDEIVLRRPGWIPNVIRKNGVLHLELGAGADANHEPRTFSFPINEDHFTVLKNDLVRSLLLWMAILPLCTEAGTDNPLNDEAAVALLDPILFGSEHEVESLFIENNWNTQGLIAYNADATLLNQGKLFAALQKVTEEADQQRAAEYAANKERASREVVLSELDEAILRYTGQFLYRSGIPARKPDEVTPDLLSQVLEVITLAEKAADGTEFSPNPLKDQPYRIKKEEWNALSNKVAQALTTTYPSLTSDAINSISNLLCSEAFARARKA